MSSLSDYPASSEFAATSGAGSCWDVAFLFPERGNWSEADYLALDTNRLVELSDGSIEVLPMAEWVHYLIVEFLLETLKTYVKSRDIGKVVFAPVPVLLWADKFRQPDIYFVRNDRPKHRKYVERADLAIEVVSDGVESRKRDYVTKRAEYAKAGISEYWIVDPELQQSTVLALEGETYREHGVFTPGQIASSKLLEGFSVAAADVFAAANG